MFAAAGVGVYSAAMFHLLTHAFFKAMLFLGAGSVIHAMHHEQDMRNYGNLRKKIPLTFGAMMIGTLAITGVGLPLTHIGFAGFLSKDAIIESTFAAGSGAGMYAFWLLVVGACMTSFYSWRLMFLTFYGKERGDHHTHEHAHESPSVMTIPLGLLAIGAIFSGMIWYSSFFDKDFDQFFGMHDQEYHAAAPADDTAHGASEAKDDHAKKETKPNTYVPGDGALYLSPDNHVMHDAHYVPTWVKLAPFVAMLLGFVTSFWFYIINPSLPQRLASQQRGLYAFLLNKWYFDEIYHFIFIRPAMWLGRFLWKQGDGSPENSGSCSQGMFFTMPSRCCWGLARL